MHVHLGSIRMYAVLYALGMVVHLAIALALARRVGCRKRVAAAISQSYAVGMTGGAVSCRFSKDLMPTTTE